MSLSEDDADESGSDCCLFGGCCCCCGGGGFELVELAKDLVAPEDVDNSSVSEELPIDRESGLTNGIRLLKGK